MPDTHTDITAEESLPCSKEQADAIFRTLIGDEKPQACDDGTTLRAVHEDSCFSAEYYTDEQHIYFFGERSVSIDAIPETLIQEVGKLLQSLGREFLSFGIAFTCSRHCTGSFGGGTFRITSQGKLEEATVTWPAWKISKAMAPTSGETGR